ncbi:glutamate-cysteine ligase [Alteromonadaceae bacterium Bs31]|nr:glutamate-cysteine ligase [Alteromonadaceae bacterium Bs31]
MFELEELPKELFEAKNSPLLTGILRGAERESLRVSPNGHLSREPHPAGLGSALTHPQITTDFSEALLEFITPPCHTVDDMLGQLDLLQRYTAAQLSDGELLWSHSMPCGLGEDADIPVALYGDSNNGRMKTIYRVGLGHRYGRSMQTVAGLHYNFSLPNAFWAFLSRRENSICDLQEFKNQRYFGLIRNFRRHYWLLIYLFGASPAICKSFIGEREHSLQMLEGTEYTMHLPFGTSLRMGDLGYQSSAQENLHVCYNSKNSYIESLCAAITRAHPEYQAVGVKDAQGNYQQLNTGLLQIENEFYSAIRPKRPAHHGETALAALDNRGVEYIEVRCLDINPFSPLGIDAEQVHFLDTFLLYCALKQSPEASMEDADISLGNQKTVVNAGRAPAATLTHPTLGTMPLKDWGESLLDAMQEVAELLDTAHDSKAYCAALEAQRDKLADASLTPSAKILHALRSDNMDYSRYALQLSQQHHQSLLDRPLPLDLLDRFESMALESLAEQKSLETASQKPFDEFLADYYKQYRRCCGQFM